MTKIEKVLNDYDNAVKDKAELAAEIEKLKAKQKRLESEAEKAGDDDNLELFRKIRNEARDTEDEIFFKSRRLEKFSVIQDKKTANAAWSEYADAYNKKLSKALEAYTKAKADLRKAYFDMTALQNEALKTRDRLAISADVPLDWSLNVNALDRVFPMNTIPSGKSKPVNAGLHVRTPDVLMFNDIEPLDNKTVEFLNYVIDLHKPH